MSETLRCACLFVIVVCCFLLAPAPALAQSDVQAPQLVEFSFAPASVDVLTGPQSVTVTLRVTDDISGVEVSNSQMEVRFRSPSGAQFRGVSGPGSGFLRILGHGLDGTWEGSFDIPQFSEDGIWTIEFVFLADEVSNTVALDADDLENLGFPTELDVISVQDSQPPQLAAMVLTPSIDVSAGPATVTATLQVIDDLTGMQPGVSQLEIRFRSPSGQQFRGASGLGFEFLLITGDALDGQWRADFEVPQFSEAGTWMLEFVFLADAVGNATILDAAQVQGLGLPTEFEVISAPDDTAPPQLVDLSLLPILIDTTLGDQPVVVTVRVTDDLTGMQANLSQLEVRYRSPSGQQFRGASGLGFEFILISGDALDGTWEATFIVPEFSEAGTWRVEFVFLVDAIGNTSILDEAQVQGLGLPTTLIVVEPSLVVDGTVDPVLGGTIIDSVFTTSAQVTVPAGVLAASTDVAIDVFESPLDVPTPVGFTAPGTNFVNIDLDPEPAYPLPPPGLTVTLPLTEFLAPGSTLDLFRIDPGTGQLVPALDVFGIPIVGTVDPAGFSATFTGISELSTIVALIPDQLTVLIDIKPGGTPNSINRKSKGKVPVAILSTPTFSAPAEVMIPLLRFGATGNEPSLSHCAPNGEDVNGDGLLDLVCHFSTQSAGFANDTEEGILTGETVGGTLIEGRDAVRIVGKGRP